VAGRLFVAGRRLGCCWQKREKKRLFSPKFSTNLAFSTALSTPGDFFCFGQPERRSAQAM
jgi:hypothetical protein